MQSRTPITVEEEIKRRTQEIKEAKNLFKQLIQAFSYNALTATGAFHDAHDGESVDIRSEGEIKTETVFELNSKIKELEGEIKGNTITIDEYNKVDNRVTEAAKTLSSVKVQAKITPLDKQTQETKEGLEAAKKELKELQEKLAEVQKVKTEFENQSKDAETKFNEELKNANSELDKLEKEYKNLKQEGEKILKLEETKILNQIVNKAIVNKINGVDEQISDIAKNIKTTDLNDKLTKDQIDRLNALTDNLSGKSGVNQDITRNLKTAIDKEAEKGVEVLKKSEAYKKVEGQLNHYIKNSLLGKSDLYNSQEKSQLNQIKNSIELSIKSGELSWKVKDNIANQADAKGVVDNLNGELNFEGSKLKAFKGEFKDLVNNVANSQEVQSAWKILLEAIKELFKGNIKEAGQKMEEISKQSRIKDIIRNYEKKNQSKSKAEEVRLSSKMGNALLQR